ncbi:MAG TPA: hypothetical protein VF773_02355 [Verrucomicrobiae bacterium]
MTAEASSRQVVEMKSPSLEQFNKAARSLTGDQRVPYAFEKRIMAHLKNARPADVWNACAPMMWRAALSCLLITAITAAVVEFADPSRAELMATDLERTVLAPVDVDDSW